MKKYSSIILSILCILILAGCSKKEQIVPDTPNAMVPSIIYQGSLYRTTGKQIPAEVDESAFVGEISSVVPLNQLPTKEGEANFGEIGDQYAITSDGLLVKMNNEWTLFELSEMELSDGAPLAPDVSDKDLESVSYIEVMSGLTGQRIKVKDADSVQKVMDDIESLKYKKKNSVEEVGYAYRIRFYNENDDELGRIFITEENGHQISYDGYYYLVEADQNINVEYLEELLVDAPPAEPGDEGNDELPDIEVEETITYNGKEYKKSELCDATLHWLELSEQEKMLSSYMPPEFMIFEETWGITLTAETVTPTSATIKCTQSGGEPAGELHTGSWYILETWTQENGWKEMPYIIDGEIGWEDIAWIIPMDGTCEWEINWEWLYGTIPAGKYRIGKELMDFRGTGDFDKAIYFVEFSIEQDESYGLCGYPKASDMPVE